jgi:ribulose-5-phosphate 4-epimerase/fuculose-1-phosphate aldolase
VLRKTSENEAVSKLRKKVATACRILARQGLCDYAGTVSARIPGTDRILINCQVGFPNMLFTAPENVMILDITGKVMGSRRVAPNETPAHFCIYEARSDVNSIAHTHPFFTTVFSMSGTRILPVFIRGLKSTSCGIPVFRRSDEISTTALGKAAARTLGSGYTCLLRAHGMVTAGRTVEETCLEAINVEQSAKMQFLASLIGEPQRISKEDSERRIKRQFDMRSQHNPWVFYASMIELDKRRGSGSNLSSRTGRIRR